MFRFRFVIASVFLTLASVSAQAAPTFVRFGDSAAAVDLTGSFVYAVSANREAAGRKVGDATFSWMKNTPGFVPGNANAFDELARDTESYYDKPGLNIVMRDWAFSDGGKEFIPEFHGLELGHWYKWQVLINVRPFAKVWDCPIGGNCQYGSNSNQQLYEIVNNYGIHAKDYVYDSDTQGVNSLLITETFWATNETLKLHVVNKTLGQASRVNAMTLEDLTPNSSSPQVNGVPEPATFTLVGCGLLALGLARRRKAS